MSVIVAYISFTTLEIFQLDVLGNKHSISAFHVAVLCSLHAY